MFTEIWKRWKINEVEKKDFPKQLKNIKDSPKKLYYRGNWNMEIFENSLAVVGSRDMSLYGKEVIAKFVPDLVSNKITIISGFMYGVDVESHQKCLECGGKTIAVLGCGLNVSTSKENGSLYTKILENGGLVISEYEADFKPTRWSFPQRNRIVAGLSILGVLVVEAKLKSGSLITAKIGRKQGKKVYVIPGQITSETSEGTNYLIKNNLGKMVTSAADILNDSVLNIQDTLF